MQVTTNGMLTSDQADMCVACMCDYLWFCEAGRLATPVLSDNYNVAVVVRMQLGVSRTQAPSALGGFSSQVIMFLPRFCSTHRSLGIDVLQRLYL